MYPLLGHIEYHKKLSEAFLYASRSDVNRLPTYQMFGSETKCPCGQCEKCLCHKPETMNWSKLTIGNIPFGIGAFKKKGLDKVILGYARVEKDNSISVVTDVDIIPNVTHFDYMTFYKYT